MINIIVKFQLSPQCILNTNVDIKYNTTLFLRENKPLNSLAYLLSGFLDDIVYYPIGDDIIP